MARPLVKRRRRDGTLYERPAKIEASIDAAHPLALQELVRRANLPLSDPERLPSECLVSLLRDAHSSGDGRRFDTLFPLLLNRCERLSYAAGLREVVVSKILEDFGDFFADQLFESTHHRLDYYECRFNRAFEKFRVDVSRRLRPPPPKDAPTEGERDATAAPAKPRVLPPMVLKDLNVLASPELPPDEIAAAKESLARSKRVAWSALDKLPEKLRDVVMLRHFFGYTVESIATKCGISERAMYLRFERAYELMKAAIKDEP